MLLHRTDGLTPIEVTQGCHASAAVESHVTFGCGTRYAGQPSGLAVSELLADQPKDFHSHLHSWIGMRIPFLSEKLQIFLRKRQRLPLGHSWTPSRQEVASHRE